MRPAAWARPPPPAPKAGGEGILPSGSGWVTLDLQPGRYELLCNLPGHYRAGMYTELTVT